MPLRFHRYDEDVPLPPGTTREGLDPNIATSGDFVYGADSDEVVAADEGEFLEEFAADIEGLQTDEETLTFLSEFADPDSDETDFRRVLSAVERAPTKRVPKRLKAIRDEWFDRQARAESASFASGIMGDIRANPGVYAADAGLIALGFALAPFTAGGSLPISTALVAARGTSTAARVLARTQQAGRITARGTAEVLSGQAAWRAPGAWRIPAVGGQSAAEGVIAEIIGGPSQEEFQAREDLLAGIGVPYNGSDEYYMRLMMGGVGGAVVGGGIFAGISRASPIVGEVIDNVGSRVSHNAIDLARARIMKENPSVPRVEAENKARLEVRDKIREQIPGWEVRQWGDGEQFIETIPGNQFRRLINTPEKMAAAKLENYQLVSGDLYSRISDTGTIGDTLIAAKLRPDQNFTSPTEARQLWSRGWYENWRNPAKEVDPVVHDAPENVIRRSVEEHQDMHEGTAATAAYDRVTKALERFPTDVKDEALERAVLRYYERPTAFSTDSPDAAMTKGLVKIADDLETALMIVEKDGKLPDKSPVTPRVKDRLGEFLDGLAHAQAPKAPDDLDKPAPSRFRAISVIQEVGDEPYEIPGSAIVSQSPDDPTYYVAKGARRSGAEEFYIVNSVRRGNEPNLFEGPFKTQELADAEMKSIVRAEARIGKAARAKEACKNG